MFSKTLVAPIERVKYLYIVKLYIIPRPLPDNLATAHILMMLFISLRLMDS